MQFATTLHNVAFMFTCLIDFYTIGGPNQSYPFLVQFVYLKIIKIIIINVVNKDWLVGSWLFKQLSNLHSYVNQDGKGSQVAHLQKQWFFN